MNIKNWFKHTAAAVNDNFISDREVIEKIHNEFDGAADKALKQANFILDSLKDTAREKGNMMKSLGFTNTAEAKKVDEAVSQENESKKRAQIVLDFQQKYPQYKFIFWDQVESICKKYNLVCGKSSLYKGDIPLKNLKEIKDFKVDKADIYYAMYHREMSFMSFGERQMEISNASSWVSENAIEGYHQSNQKEASTAWEVPVYGSYRSQYHFKKIPFHICAPIKDMETEGMKQEGVFLQREIPDPIVLHPMKEGALIVSKWGIEGDDPELTNEKMN